MAREWNPATIFEVLGNETARRILVLGMDEPVSASELADALEVSQPTVYRRLEALQQYDFITRHTHLNAQGHRYHTYETTLERIALEMDEGELIVDFRLKSEFQQAIQDLRDSFGD